MSQTLDSTLSTSDYCALCGQVMKTPLQLHTREMCEEYAAAHPEARCDPHRPLLWWVRQRNEKRAPAF